MPPYPNSDPKKTECCFVHNWGCQCAFTQPTSDWKERIWEKYSDKGDERFGLSKHNNTVLQNIIDDVYSEIRKEKELSRDATIALFEEWAKAFIDQETMHYGTDKHGISLADLFAFADSLKK